MLVKDQQGATYPIDNKTCYEATVIKTVRDWSENRPRNRMGWYETLLYVRGGI